MLLESIDERIRVANSIRACVQKFSSAEYDEAQELVYVWAHLEVVMRRFLNELLPRVKDAKASAQVCQFEQDIRSALEEVFSLIQLPKSYRSFVYPIDELD